MRVRSLVLMAALSVFPIAAGTATAQTSATWTVSGSWGADGYRRAGDFNGDGKTDIAAPFGTNVYMRLSTGSGFTFETWTVDDGDYGANGANVIVGDFNCDGYDDLGVAQVRTNPPNYWITVKYNMKGSGSNSFDSENVPLTGQFVTSIGDVSMTKVGNYDNDGCKDDIVSPLPGSGLLRLYKKIFTPAHPIGTNGTFFMEEQLGAGSWNGANWTFGGEFNCDARDDLASANGNSVYMKIRNGINPPPDAFIFPTWTAPGSWATTGYARAGDFNGDCLTDIASPKTGVGQIYLKTNTNPGFSDSIVSVSSDWGTAGLTFVGDFDGNGRDDIASSPGNSNIYMKLF